MSCFIKLFSFMNCKGHKLAFAWVSSWWGSHPVLFMVRTSPKRFGVYVFKKWTCYWFKHDIHVNCRFARVSHFLDYVTLSLNSLIYEKIIVNRKGLLKGDENIGGIGDIHGNKLTFWIIILRGQHITDISDILGSSKYYLFEVYISEISAIFEVPHSPYFLTIGCTVPY